MSQRRGQSKVHTVVSLALMVMLGVLAGNLVAGRAAATYSGSTYVSTNPVSTWYDATKYCSWNAYYDPNLGFPDARCYLDNNWWYSSSQTSGSVSQTIPAGSLSIGNHSVVMYYATGTTQCIIPGKPPHFIPCYSWASASFNFQVTEPSWFNFKVVDKNLNGISNVGITLEYSASSCTQGCTDSAVTDSTGFANLSIRYFTPRNTYSMHMGKIGHWQDVQSFVGTQNYYVELPADQLVYVYSIVGLSNSIYSQLSWTNGVSFNVDVGAYVAGSGFDLTYTVTKSTTFTSPAPPNGKPLEERDGYYSTGIFHYNPSTKTYTIDNAWIYGPRATLDFGYFIPDYFTPSTATGGTCFFSPCTFGVGPGVSISNTVTVAGSLTVQLGLDVSVGVDVNVIVGVSVSVELKVYLSVTVGTSYSLTWLISNTDTVSHTFEVYDETASATAIIPHIWTVS